MNFDLINSDIFADTLILPDEANWLEEDDIADDNLRASFRRQDWTDDEPPLCCDSSDAVDSYLRRAHGVDHLRFVPEAW
jgi:hypothetical protein